MNASNDPDLRPVDLSRSYAPTRITSFLNILKQHGGNFVLIAFSTLDSSMESMCVLAYEPAGGRCKIQVI